MQKGTVYNNQHVAGIISKDDTGQYHFEYDTDYYYNDNMPPISLSFPKTKKKYSALLLFPFFYNMLSEGANRKLQCRILKIDEEDHFTVLLKTTALETIGAVTVREIKEHE